MVQTEKAAYCPNCGMSVIRVPLNVTFAGTLHVCDKQHWVVVESGGEQAQAETKKRKIKKWENPSIPRDWKRQLRG